MDSSTSYTLNDLIQTNEEGIWKFEFDGSTVRGISLTNIIIESDMAYDNFECNKEFCTSKTNVEVGNWIVTVEMEKDTEPLIKTLQVGEGEDYNCEGENSK